MRKLLSANFTRVFHSLLFWACAVFMAVLGAFMAIMNYIDMKETNSINSIDNIFFACAIFIGIVGAIFCSLFIGTEYSDGTIRNKIIVGHKRSAIYLANLITAGAVSLLLCGISFLTTLCFGLPLLGGFTNDLKVILAIALCTLLLSLALASIFTLIALLCQNKAFTAILCVVFAFIVLLVGGYVIQRLQEPETYDAYVTTMGEEGAGASSTVQKDIPNPNYLRGTQRQIYQFLADFLPGGQAIQCNSCIVSNPPLLYAYSILIILGTTGAGLLLFARKDLK